MTVLEQMIEICDFLKKNVCDKLAMLVPPADDVIGEDYISSPKRAHPEIFPMTFDSDVGEGGFDESGNPVSVKRAQAPAICVQLTAGNDAIDSRERTITVRLVLQSWNPGIFTQEGIYEPHDDASAFANAAYTAGTESSYIRNFDGWKESMVFMDTALKAIEQAEVIGHMSVVKDEPIKFGPYTLEGEFVRFYPYWLNTVTFKLKAYQRPVTKSDDMLDF